MIRNMVATVLAVACGLGPAAAPALAQGPAESIAIRGQWELTVRDSGGKVISKREFDNALSPFSGLLFQALLGRQGSLGYYQIHLSSGNDAAGNPYVNPFGAQPGLDTFNQPTPAIHRVSEPIATMTVLGGNDAPFGGVQLSARLTATVAGTLTAVGTGGSICVPTVPPAECTTSNTIRGPLTATDIPPLRLELGQVLEVTVKITVGSMPHPPSL